MTWRTLSEFHNLYLIVAGIFGTAFLILTPPFGVGDETTHFERTYEIASGQWFGADGLPAGFLQFRDSAFDKVLEGDPFTASEITALTEIEMQQDEIVPYPNPLRKVLRINNPINYAHLAPIMASGLALNLNPFWIFYLCRFASLVIGLLLIRFAIKTLPFQKHSLTLIALFPTTIFFFAGINVESVMIGLAFLYFALVVRHSVVQTHKITQRDILILACIAFFIGQFKAAYFLLPLFAILIPQARFHSVQQRIIVLALVFFPAFMATLGWSMIAKEIMIGDFAYATGGGTYVQPGEQLAFVFADLFRFFGILLSTVFETDLLPYSWASMLGILGWTNIPLHPLVYGTLGLTVFLCWFSGEKAPNTLTGTGPISLQVTIFTASIGITLCLLYLQWTGVGGPTVEGFQGRYIIPVLPMILALAPLKLSLLDSSGRRKILVFGTSTPVLMIALLTMSVHYY